MVLCIEYVIVIIEGYIMDATHSTTSGLNDFSLVLDERWKFASLKFILIITANLCPLHNIYLHLLCDEILGDIIKTKQ